MRVIRLLPLLAALLLAAGCAGRNAPTHYYLLQAQAVPAPETSGAPVLGVGPVTLRSYLNRNEIVTEEKSGELRLADFDHWAEPLRENVGQVLMENLGRLTGARQVLAYPWPHTRRVDVQVEVDVTRFHADAGGNVVLWARWSIFRGETLLRAGQSNISVGGDNKDYQAIVNRQSEALAALSREIAQAILPAAK